MKAAAPLNPTAQAPSAPTQTKTVGSDWTSAVIVSDSGALPAEVNQVLKSAPTVSGAFGTGQLLTTPLVNVLRLNDGRIAIGAVTASALENAVASAH